MQVWSNIHYYNNCKYYCNVSGKVTINVNIYIVRNAINIVKNG